MWYQQASDFFGNWFIFLIVSPELGKFSVNTVMSLGNLGPEGGGCSSCPGAWLAYWGLLASPSQLRHLPQTALGHRETYNFLIAIQGKWNINSTSQSTSSQLSLQVQGQLKPWTLFIPLPSKEPSSRICQQMLRNKSMYIWIHGKLVQPPPPHPQTAWWIIAGWVNLISNFSSCPKKFL